MSGALTYLWEGRNLTYYGVLFVPLPSFTALGTRLPVLPLYVLLSPSPPLY